MAKHDRLTKAEFSTYKPQTRSVDALMEFMASRGARPGETKVLDWGCGRGRFVLWLREQGFDAYGVDVDPEPIQNGLPLFAEKGYLGEPLSVIDVDGRTRYTDGFFDFVFTDNVIEHVKDLDLVVKEITRLTAVNGGGYHIFPAQRQFREGHLFMPLVHWIPAGPVRKTLVRLFVTLGVEPRWEEVVKLSKKEKTEAYYRYSINNIHYRPYRAILSLFRSSGFKTTLLTIQHPSVVKHPLFGPFVRMRWSRPALQWLLVTFKQVEFRANKTS